jgi:hypothetical protein
LLKIPLSKEVYFVRLILVELHLLKIPLPKEVYFVRLTLSYISQAYLERGSGKQRRQAATARRPTPQGTGGQQRDITNTSKRERRNKKLRAQMQIEKSMSCLEKSIIFVHKMPQIRG